MEPKFQVGDVVRLIIGGPKMIVESLHYKNIDPYKSSKGTYFTGLIYCQWFGDKKVNHLEPFEQDLLVLVKNE